MSHEHLDEAYERLRTTGPEFEGWLSNHGPMAAEVLDRHGHQDALPRWLDRYARRLEPAPRPVRRIDDWSSALGDARRLGDWLGRFDAALRDQPWEEVLRTWWPRLLPGIAAGATHGVIRVGHAVRVLRDHGPTAPRVAELGQGLGYWAARWQPVPGAAGPGGPLGVEAALAAVPRLAQQEGGIRSRLAGLDRLPGWTPAQRALAPTEDPDQLLRDVVTAAARRYATHAHGNPVMLVHAVTAPNAVLRVLPSLPRSAWPASAAAAWSATAAVHAAYAPATGRPAAAAETSSGRDALDRAVRHGDEHVIKLADSVLDAHRWTGDDQLLAVVDRAVLLVDPA